jgi:hypothetical protein
MTASRSRWYGKPASIAVCTAVMTSPASAPIAGTGGLQTRRWSKDMCGRHGPMIYRPTESPKLLGNCSLDSDMAF